MPTEFLDRWAAYGKHLATTQPAALALTVLGLLLIFGLRRWKPKWPGFLIALLACTFAAAAFALPAETIGTRFGDLPSALPRFEIPHIPFERTFELLPSAFTIAVSREISASATSTSICSAAPMPSRRASRI